MSGGAAEVLPGLLSVDRRAFTVLGYPMSFVELFGTIFYLWSVRLMARGRTLTWPVGMVSVILYMLLFYQIRLYSDALEQVYYLGASVYGWWRWTLGAGGGAGEGTATRYSAPAAVVVTASATGVLAFAAGAAAGRLHLWFPPLFPEEASYPYLDAATTVMSFTAMFLMTVRRVESWIYWIAVDVAGIWLYYVKEVKFVSLLYVVLLVMAIQGLWMWRTRSMEEQAREDGEVRRQVPGRRGT